MERMHFQQNTPTSSMELSVHLSRYRLVSEQVAGKRVLDIACGEGWGSYVMARCWGAGMVHGVDISPQAIRSARMHFSCPNIEWGVMDAENMDISSIDRPYDIIISIETIEHLSKPRHFLESISRLIRPGGLIVISCPNDKWFYGPGRSKNPYHLKTYTFEGFKELTESVLGKAIRFYIGTKAEGFSVVPIGSIEVTSGKVMTRLNRIPEVNAIEILPEADLLPEKEYALFFMGAWGELAPKLSYTVSPIHPEKRFPLDHLRPLGVGINGPKKKITLVADTPGWAYDNISKNIQKHLSDLFEIHIVYVIHFNNYNDFFMELFCRNDSDFIHIFWREYLFAMVRHIDLEKLRSQIDPRMAAERFANKILTTSIYDHLYLSDPEVMERQSLFAVVDGYNVGSNRLKEIYNQKMNVCPDVVIEDGVDTDLYRPLNLNRFTETNRELVVGWAGNSQWHLTKTDDPKGLHTILNPAIEIIKAKGLPIKSVFADVSEKRRPRSEMPGYYNSIDVLVCSSAIEGTPNPVLEAMSCGIPIISTDVGIIPELFGPGQQEFILKNRSAKEMAEKLEVLIRDRSLLLELSKENLDRIQRWRWEHHMTKWMQLFKAASLRHDSRSIYRKQRLFLSYLQTLPERRKGGMNGFIKKVAFWIYPDSIFWKNAKAKVLKPFRRHWNRSS